MKKYTALFFLLSALFITNHVTAQDDLPPPTSRPEDQKPQAEEEFVGFKPKKKVDLSKFIIEPNFNFFVTQSNITLGLSPYVGYKVWEPKKVKPSSGNVGLFVGGGFTYIFNQVQVQTDPNFSPVYYGTGRMHSYGGGVFLQYNIWKGLFTRAKFELLHRSGDDLYSSTVRIVPGVNGGYEMKFDRLNKTIPALLIGAGYNLLQSKNFFMPILISYNVLHPFTPSDQRRYSAYNNANGFVFQLGFINIF